MSGRQLPPISPRSDRDDGADSEQLPRRRPRKKKKPVEGESGRKPSRESRARSGEEVDMPEPDAEGQSPRTPRPKTKKKRSRSVSRQRHEDEEASAANATNPKDTEPTPKKRPKKGKKAASGSTEQLVREDEVDDLPSPTDGARPHAKKKKRKKVKARESGDGEEAEDLEVGLAADLSGIKDDVVETEEADPEPSQLSPPAMRSEPIGRLFIEQRSGFKSADKFKMAQRRAEQQRQKAIEEVVPPTRTTIQFGLATHRVLKTLSLFCHGLLAGISLWQSIVVFSLSNHGYKILLDYYYTLALPVQSMYYLLLVICMVSVCDRYDIGRPNKHFLLRAVTMQSGAISVLVYAFALILSVSIAAVDDKIGLYKINPDLWKDEGARDAELNSWRILNLVRGVAAILGWFIVSLKPGTDRLSKNLEKADENILGDNVMDLQHIRSNGV